MDIQMIGTDYSLAGVEVREKFAFTKTQAAALMKKWKKRGGLHGIVVLSTCNRIEIYVNSDEENTDYCRLLCEEKGVDAAQYRSFFYVRTGAEAVRRLFEVTAGLHSLILGEDQILAQVKDALSFAREEYAADQALEILFRQAVTTAKEIKTKGLLSGTDISAAQGAVEGLKKQNMTLAGKKCLVIGNGIMGRLTAQALLREGAEVTVTVRQYHKGVVDIPAGAVRIDYGRRYEVLPGCDYVFSATASPNVTVTREALERCSLKKRQVFVDLAVPRDIDPSVGKSDLITLYDVDDFSLREVSRERQQGIEEAFRLTEEGAAAFQSQYECRELIPAVRRIAELSAADLCGRLEKPFRQIEEKKREELLSAVSESGSKVTARLLFALRDELDAEAFRKCVDILEGKFSG